MDKFENFYSEKSVSELLKQLRDAKISRSKIDKVWYDALIVHLQKRDLTPGERQLLDQILSSDQVSLMRDVEAERVLQREQRRAESVLTSGGSKVRRYTTWKVIKIIFGIIVIMGAVNKITQFHPKHNLFSHAFLASDDSSDLVAIGFLLLVGILLIRSGSK